MIIIVSDDLESFLSEKLKKGAKEPIVLRAKYESYGAEGYYLVIRFSLIENHEVKLKAFYMLEENYNSAFVKLMNDADAFKDEGYLYFDNLRQYEYDVHLTYDEYLHTYRATSIVLDKDSFNALKTRKELKGEENNEE